MQKKQITCYWSIEDIGNTEEKMKNCFWGTKIGPILFILLFLSSLFLVYSEPAEVVVKVTVDTFIKDFKLNKLNAENKYIGQILELTGPIKSIEKSAIRKRPRVTFAKDELPIAGITITDIDCYFPKEAVEQLYDLRAGEKVTIRGLCKDSDTLDNCEIVKEEKKKKKK